MSNYDVDYHLKQLKYYSGKDWAVQATDLGSALANSNIQRRRLTIVDSTMRILGGIAAFCACLIAFGIACGIFGVFRTDGPVVAAILPGVLLGVASVGARFGLGISVRPEIAAAAETADRQYRKQLEKEIA